MYRYGQNDQRTAPPLYVCDNEQEHETGITGKEVPVQPRIQVQAEPPPASRTPRHSITQIQNRNFRKRLFLARTRKLQILCPTQK